MKVRRLHFICVGDRHVEDRADGTFLTGYWKVSAQSAQSAEILALHPSRNAPSTRQGRIVERHPVIYNGGRRYTFVVQPDSTPVDWEGGGTGEKGYGY